MVESTAADHKVIHVVQRKSSTKAEVEALKSEITTNFKRGKKRYYIEMSLESEFLFSFMHSKNALTFYFISGEQDKTRHISFGLPRSTSQV